MANFDQNRFESSSQEWETPDDLFEFLDDEFRFTRDVCASADNKKCADFWSEEDSCLDKEWRGVNWMNPPYKKIKDFVRKAFEQRDNAITVALIPARTNTAWWHEFCMSSQVRFICGRPKFKGCIHGMPQPLAVVIFGRSYSPPESLFLNDLPPITASL